MDETYQRTCCAGMQAMGTLLGTMFGFVSAALLTPIRDEEIGRGIPAAPGVVVGSSLGVLAAYSAAEGNQSLPQMMFLLALSILAAAATTAACSWLVGDILQNRGSTGIIVLSTVASLGPTAAFTFLEHRALLRRTAEMAGGAEAWDEREMLPRNRAPERDPLMGPKEV